MTYLAHILLFFLLPIHSSFISAAVPLALFHKKELIKIKNSPGHYKKRKNGVSYEAIIDSIPGNPTNSLVGVKIKIPQKFRNQLMVFGYDFTSIGQYVSKNMRIIKLYGTQPIAQKEISLGCTIEKSFQQEFIGLSFVYLPAL